MKFYKALKRACELDRMDLVKFLVENGACVGKESYNAPLIACIKNGNIEMVKYLLDNGANPNDTIYTYDRVVIKMTPMYFAIAQNRMDIIELLFKYGADVSEGNYITTYNPLYIALVKKSRYDILERLFQNNVYTNFGIDDKTLLEYVMERDDMDLFKLFVKYGCN